jgi:hypothetical protein
MQGQGCDVFLNVYDLVEQNSWTHWAGVGVYHSGVEVYGREFAFGGHEYDAPGVFATDPQRAPGTVALREVIHMGYTTLSQKEVYEAIKEMCQQYKGNKYHLLQMNCNTFSSDLCFKLTGRRPPSYVNRLADVAVLLHCLLPQGWVPPLRPPTASPEAIVVTDPKHSLAGTSGDGLYEPPYIEHTSYRVGHADRESDREEYEDEQTSLLNGSSPNFLERSKLKPRVILGIAA